MPNNKAHRVKLIVVTSAYKHRRYERVETRKRKTYQAITSDKYSLRRFVAAVPAVFICHATVINVSSESAPVRLAFALVLVFCGVNFKHMGCQLNHAST